MIEKPEIKKLSNIKLLHELPFYDELSITEISKAFKSYARSYKVEIVDHKDSLVDGDIEYSSVYFNSISKTVINSEFSLDKSFQEILYRIDNWINEGSGWIIESINAEYVNISMYSPLIGSSFVKLPNELKNPKKA